MINMDKRAVIKYPRSTEKSIRLMESNNVLVFVVDRKATKQDIKAAIEKEYKVHISAVNTHITKGEKRAYVKFAKESPAIDVATNLGLI